MGKGSTQLRHVLHAAHGDSGGHLCQLLVLLVAAALAGKVADAAAPANASPPLQCPGVSHGVCQQQCQLHICEQLAAFYKVSTNVSDPWDEERGWQVTNTQPCQRLVTAKSRQPPYCSWHGITCCAPADVAQGSCSTVHTVWVIELPLNNLNVSVDNAEWLATIQHLHDCGLTVLSLEANQLSGNMSGAWGNLLNLKVLNLANAWIEGPIPAVLRRLNLQTINLSNNFLTGTLPDWLGEMMQLEVLNLGSQAGTTEETGLHSTIPAGIGRLKQLRVLNLEANWLTGEIPEDLCEEGNSLVQLNLRANSLEGPATAVEKCTRLVQLDLSDNDFEGPLPVARSWQDLTTYTLSDNNFSGRFPLPLCLNAKILETLDISRNGLTGALPTQVGVLGSLQTFFIAGNSFTGTIPEDLLYLPAIRRIDLSNNKFFGTIPLVAIGFPYGLLDIDLGNNTGVTGIVPAQMGYLYNMQRARLTNTSMSCAGIIRPYNVTTNASCSNPDYCKTPQLWGSTETIRHYCSPEQVLPCFLRFSEEALPLDNASNMRCKNILRKHPDQAKADCADAPGEYSLGAESDALPIIERGASEQQWLLDASYWQYRGCSCLMGFGEVWEVNNTVLRCVELPSTDRKTSITVACISAVAGVAMLAALLLVAQLYLRTQPRWLREHIMESKRKQGPPKCKGTGEKVHVSIVVTDVKDFTALTRRNPEAMSKAMGVHNNILRKACHAHAGYVLDQEGDSWTVVFRDAEDAVAFSLQVQQALAHKAWVLPLLSTATQDSGLALLSGSPSAAKSLELLHSGDTLRHEGFSLKGSMAAPGSTSELEVLLQNPIGTTPASTTAATAAAAAATTAPNQVSQLVLQPSASQGLPTVLGSPAVAVLSTTTTGSGLGPNSAAAQPSATGSSAPQQSDLSLRQEMRVSTASAAGPQNASFTHSTHSMGRGKASSAASSHSGSELFLQSGNLAGIGSSGNPFLGRLFGQALSRPGSQASDTKSPEAHSIASEYVAANTGAGGPAVLQPTLSARQQQLELDSGGSWAVAPSAAGMSEGSSAVRLKAAATSFMQRITGRASGVSLGSVGPGGPSTVRQQPQLQVLQLSVRIGVSSGLLPCGCDVSDCAVKFRAKDLVSDVANGGQILIDEPTFLLVKDSLTVLGTVGESGYDDVLLQQLLQAKVVGKLQQQLACYCRTLSRELSMTGGLLDREPQDYDSDAICCHMGAFLVPDAPVDAAPDDASASGKPQPHASSEPPDLPKAAAAAAPATELQLLLTSFSNARKSCHKVEQQQLHLYSIAAPGMRLPPQSTHDLSQLLGWAEPVRMKPGWLQVQKGYFEAPGAPQMDLTPSLQLRGNTHAPLPEVTVVFAAVENGAPFAAQHSREEVHALNKQIIKCMVQQLRLLPAGDGYLCRCQESDLHYMLAFEQAHLAARWSLLVQEALTYVDYPDWVLNHPGFGEVVHPATGRLLFRGPRLRIGFAEGQPQCVLPDHQGRANYYGTSINRAARFMDAAAHGGQTVTELPLTRKLFMDWVAQDRAYEAESPAVHSYHNRYHGDDTAVLYSRDQEQQQQQQLCLSPKAAGKPLSGHTSNGGCNSKAAHQHQHQQQQQPWCPDHSPPLLQVVHRSSSETSALKGCDSSPDQGWAGRHGLYLPLAPTLPSTRSSNSNFHACNGTGTSSRRAATAATPAAAAAGLAAAGNIGLVSRSQSYTETRLPSRLEEQQQDESQLPCTLHAGTAHCLQKHDSMLVEAAATGDAVSARHLGKYLFKGSGEFDMVELLRASIAERLEYIPSSPPGGKGERVSVVQSGERVKDLPDVRLQVSAAAAVFGHRQCCGAQTA